MLSFLDGNVGPKKEPLPCSKHVVMSFRKQWCTSLQSTIKFEMIAKLIGIPIGIFSATALRRVPFPSTRKETACNQESDYTDIAL